MSLEKFRADLNYSSTGGDYQVNYRNTPKCDAPTTLVNLIEHLCWMAVIAGKSDEARQAIERGFASGAERVAEITEREKTEEPKPNRNSFSILAKSYIVEMPDGSKFSLPVEVIALDRAAYYAKHEYEGDLEESLIDDTAPLFQSDDYEIKDWAANNMNWSDVKDKVTSLDGRMYFNDAVDYQAGWVNGPYEISKE